ESNYDFVRVYDGSSNSAPLLGSYSGTTIPNVLQSSGSSLFLTFDSDGSVTQSGWAANYTSASSVAYCSGLTTLTASSGSFNDGSAGLNYLNNSSCTWVIQPQNVNQITLNFTQFSTQANADFVTIYNGTTTSAPILGVFSGSSLPNTINANGALMVVFTSNASVTGAGLSATYTSSQVYCSGNTVLTAPIGSLSDGSGSQSYANNSNCSWLINPPGATSIVFQLTQFATESNYDYVRIYNGTTTSAPILGSYSGTTLPQQITSNGPILITFTSDGSVTYDGWSANYTAGFTTLYCSGNTNVTATSGTITDGSGSNNYGDNSNCTWLISPSNGPTSVVLTFTS
ncbi:MAG: hypothetical protein K2Q22_05720, partial [Cytophagales bacterium]|nr:hypothetical protein [Cytophagales bacterium]